MMLANSKPKTPATARLSCCWMLALWQAHEQTFTWLKKSPVFGIQQSGSSTGGENYDSWLSVCCICL